jgi:Phytanoyl-CoA dioxygenase (PhyH)
MSDVPATHGGPKLLVDAPPPTRTGLPAGWRRSLLTWLYLPTLATSAKSFRDNPAVGSAWLNRWGLHVARKRLAQRLGDMRRRQLAGLVSAEDRAALARDGFIIKRNFLDDATFRALRAEIVGLTADAREAVIGDTLTRLIPLDAVTLRGLRTTRSVLDGPVFRNLLAYVGSFKRRPHLYVQTIFSRHCEAEPDVQSFFHSDTFHPTVKAWLFLDDVAEDATPFTYVPGSHRYNRRRLAWERRLSLTARNAGDRLTAEGSLRISEREILRLGYGPPVRLPVGGNTLVVADTSGIHARGTTDRRSVRLSIWAYSRSNPFLPFVWGDPNQLPIIKGYALRLYWAVTDRLKDAKQARRDWRWVGLRSPLAPPEA